jgi:hypothetical protein
MAPDLIRRIEAYIKQYVTFDNNQYSFAAALWVLGTYFWHEVDAFPYLVITAGTKRAGKTRFSEVLSFMARNPLNMTAISPSMIFRSIKNMPTQFFDEAESMADEAAGNKRSALNSGYRKGQKVLRPGPGETTVEYETYCPKVFVLIGDMFDTVRDRAIIFRMVRAGKAPRMIHSIAQDEGHALRDEAKELVETNLHTIRANYINHDSLEFIGDRDEEIWMPLFVACEVFCPDRLQELQMIAADMCAEKTDEARTYIKLLKTDEARADQDEYTRRLLKDLLSVFRDDEVTGTTARHGYRNSGYVSTADALQRLHDLPTGPWRKFRGPGLSAIDLSNMLKAVGVRPQHIRKGTSGKAGTAVFRGYRKADVEKAVKDNCD